MVVVEKINMQPNNTYFPSIGSPLSKACKVTQMPLSVAPCHESVIIIANAVIVQTMMVSMIGSIIAMSPSLTGSSVLAAP